MNGVSQKESRTVAVSGYVELDFDEVVMAFSSDRIAGDLADAIRVGAGDIVQVVVAEPGPVERIGGRTARTTIRWLITDRDGRRVGGSVKLSFFVVQSGRFPITEVLVSVGVPDRATATATILRRTMDELVTSLGSVRNCDAADDVIDLTSSTPSFAAGPRPDRRELAQTSS